VLAFIAFFILKNEPQINSLKINLSKYVLPAMLVLTAASAWYAGNKMFCEIALRHFLEIRETGSTEEQLFYLNKINPTYCILDGTATPIAWYKGMAHFAQKNTNEEAESDFNEAVKANPYHAYSLANVGTCLSLKGDKAGAENYFRQSLLYSPGFPEAALNMAALKFNEKQPDSAAYYVGMAKDTLTSTRYRLFLNVVMKNILADMEQTETDSFVLGRYRAISTNEPWLMHICSSAYVNKISVEEQVKQDIVWSIKYDDKNPVLSNKIRNYFKLAP
jgi:tetratricopeptide (TPR) repeat protein